MKRIQVYYAGTRYTVANRELADLKEEIAGGLANGTPHWLTVNHGEGMLRETELLITPGVGVALIPIEPDTEGFLEPAPVALPGADG